MTCWRRLRDWHQVGVWEQIHRIHLEKLQHANQIDWSRASVDSGSIRAVGAGEKTGPNPTDRAKSGSKHHIIVDGAGIPLYAKLSAANVHDSRMFWALVDGIPALKERPGRPRKRPVHIFGDRAYDKQLFREMLRKKVMIPHLAKRNEAHGSGLGVYRWGCGENPVLAASVEKVTGPV